MANRVRGAANSSLEAVTAPEADFWYFGRKTATAQHKLDLETASDKSGDDKTSAARQIRNVENGTMSAAVVVQTWPEIYFFGGRSFPLGQLKKLACDQGFRIWRL